MECTQRLECSQEFYASQSEKLFPEQIGFLGICGTKYPVKKGPNKIGRDPQTCDIVLNLNSISRQHAVINILSDKDFMLMDLDSANKTKLSGKTLQAYIPHPIKNGDMVQFGQVFGVFRLLEEENDLPMTQAADIPETPVTNRHASRINDVPSTTIPESPDVSDRDDSFIKPSQPTHDDHLFKSPSNKFIKPSGKTIKIQPMGTNKIDNVFWNSSKKSKSLNLDLDDSSCSFDDSTLSVNANHTLVNQNKNDNIHEMETQEPFLDLDESTDSIYTAETQVPVVDNAALSIHSLETQLPDLCQIENGQESQLDHYSTNKENYISFHNAETQLPTNVQKKNNIDVDTDLFEAETQVFITKYKPNVSAESNKNNFPQNIHDAATQIPVSGTVLNASEKSLSEPETQAVTFEKNDIKVKLGANLAEVINKSDEVIVFDDVDSQYFEENFDSQPLLTLGISVGEVKEASQRILFQDKKEDNIKSNTPAKRDVRITSDSSTDCEDLIIMPTQNRTDNPLNDDLTDCEDEIEETQAKTTKDIDDANTQGYLDNDDFEMLPTQKLPEKEIIEEDLTNCNNFVTNSDSEIKNPASDFEDISTQVLTDVTPEPVRKEVFADKNLNENPEFEDMLTQVLVEEKGTNFEDLPTQSLGDKFLNAVSEKESSQQVFSEEIISPFKVPLPTPIKVKKKDTHKRNDSTNYKHKDEENEKYYAATQEIFEDLCSQRELSPEIIKTKTDTVNSCHISNLEEEVLLTSDGLKQTLKKIIPFSDKSCDNSDDNVTDFVKSLTIKQIREVIGVATPNSDSKPANLTRTPSYPSDVESTPKKVRPFKLMATDLPNSQEIKTSVSRKSLCTDSSSESEPENEGQEENTPILFRPKKRTHKKDAKMDLTKAFEAKALPSRIITRVRKPTSKIQEADEVTKKSNQKILKPKFLTEPEDIIDTEILTENITRLRNKSDNSKSDEIKKENTSKASDTKSKKTKEVKLETETESDQKEKANDIKPSQKTRQRSIRTHSREEIKDEKSKDLEETTMSKVSEAILSTSNIEILDNTYKSTRSTRHRNKNDRKNEKQSVSPEKAKRRKIKIKVMLKDDEDTSPENEVRRSKRNKSSKSKNENTDKKPTPKTVIRNENKGEKPKSILKNRNSLDNQSAVYTVSSESGTDSPVRPKRPAIADMDLPSPKRTRSSRSCNSASLRSTPARGMQTQYVLFTAFPSEEVKLKLEMLGAIVVTDVKDCTVVLTMQIKRTFKLLCAVGLGKPIVGPSWVQACVDNKLIVDPWLHLIKDEVSEKRFQFSLERTLGSRRNFLKGYNVSCTPSVMPNEAEMKLIVECSGGTWKAQKPQWVCVSCHADKSRWEALRQQGAVIVSTEFILSGVLRQRADVKNNRLDAK